MSTPIGNNTEGLQEILQQVQALPNAGGGGVTVQTISGTATTDATGWAIVSCDFCPDFVIVDFGSPVYHEGIPNTAKCFLHFVEEDSAFEGYCVVCPYESEEIAMVQVWCEWNSTRIPEFPIIGLGINLSYILWDENDSNIYKLTDKSLNYTAIKYT